LFICCTAARPTFTNQKAELKARRHRIEILPLKSAVDFFARKPSRDFLRLGFRRVGARPNSRRQVGNPVRERRT